MRCRGPGAGQGRIRSSGIVVLDKDFYIDGLRSESAALAEAARLGPEAHLPSCPGWSIARLLGHLGAIYISVAKNIRVGHGEDVVHELEDLDLPPEFEEWFRREYALEAIPPSVVEWYRECARELEEVFRAAEPNERTWTWWTPDQTVGFWMRRMAHETAVHRWDAQLAHGRAEPIVRELAEDGVDEAIQLIALSC